MRHDTERPRTHRLLADEHIPDHWTAPRRTLALDPESRLTAAELAEEAPEILIVSPSCEVARASLSSLFSAVETTSANPDITTAESLDPAEVTPGAWVFLPHRYDGWTELEDASAIVWDALVKERSTRSRSERFTLIEYGVNLWAWTAPPHATGDPVCHAGELISWESAWTLGDPDPAGHGTNRRPPIFFGLPPLLHERRRTE